MKRGINQSRLRGVSVLKVARFRGGRGGPHTLQSWHGSQELAMEGLAMEIAGR